MTRTSTDPLSLRGWSSSLTSASATGISSVGALTRMRFDPPSAVTTGSPIGKPVNYYHDDDPASTPENRWRSHAHLLFGNWINEVYQATPYDWV